MSMKNAIGIGVIGCGGMGRNVARRVADKDSRLQVRALFDPDARSIKVARELFGSALPACDSHEELVRRDDIDWVMIASWNSQHRDQVVAAFEAGKHVFCQKPLATTLEDCLAMVGAWQRSGRMFTIGFTLRYSPHYRKVRELIEAGAIGDIVSFEFNETLGFNHGGYIMGDWGRLRANAGTHLLEKCCHDIDLANWMVGSRADRVASFGGLDFFKPENARHIERLGHDRNGRQAYHTWGGTVNLNPFTSDKDIVDNQVAIIEYKNGVRATFHTNCNAGIPERRMYILGSEGAIRANVLTGTVEVARIGFDEEIRDESTEAKGGHGCGDDILADELAASMLEGAEPSAGMQEGLASSITCFAIDEALDTGEVIDVDRYWRKADETA